MPFSNGPLKCGMVANPSQGKVVILSCLTNTDLVNTNTPLYEQNFQRRAWQLRAFLFRYCGWLALWTTFWKNGGARVNETQLYGQHCQVWTCTALGEFFFFFFPLWELVKVAYTEAFSLSECESQPSCPVCAPRLPLVAVVVHSALRRCYLGGVF